MRIWDTDGFMAGERTGGRKKDASNTGRSEKMQTRDG